MSDTNSEAPKEHFPLFKSMDEAVAYCEKTGDNYYLTAFMLEMWAGDLITKAVEKYAERKPNKRDMQSGEAFNHEIFRDLFTSCEDPKELAHFLQSLCRFALEEDSYAEVLRESFALFGTENEVNAVARPQDRPTIAELRRYIARYCDWYESRIHSMVHTLYYYAPGSVSSPDEESRHLFALGVSQSGLPDLRPYDQEFWQWNHETALSKLTDPRKWKFIGQGFANEKARSHSHPEIDDAIITLWPLVRRFNWTYHELLNVLEAIAPRYRGRYPCDAVESIQKHCTLTVGLKKGTGDRRGPAGKAIKRDQIGEAPLPEGFEIVKAMTRKDHTEGK